MRQPKPLMRHRDRSFSWPGSFTGRVFTFHFSLLAWLCVCTIGEQSVAAFQSSPQLNLIMPRGVQRGQQHTLTFHGERLNESKEILLYCDGVTVSNLKQVNPKTVQATVQVQVNCRLGQHIAQVRTARGISEFRTFWVGAMADITEVEPNNSIDKAQLIQLNRTVNGTIINEDTDHFCVQTVKGQRISIEVEAIRLGTRLIDPVVSVLDEAQNLLHHCDDTIAFKQDGLISFVSQKDQLLTIRIGDATRSGSDNHHYRLHVGQFPRPTIAYPAGGKIGSIQSVELIGDPAGPIVNTVKVAKPDRFDEGLFYSDDKGITPSAIPFRFSTLDNSYESEPNQNFKQSTKINVPGAFNGRFQGPLDQDWFQFECEKGQVIDFEVFGQRIHSPIDAQINVFGPDRKHIKGNDDSRNADPYLRFTASVKGTHYLRIKEAFDRGGPQFVYRIEASQPSASLQLGIPRVARYSQYRQSVFVPQGNRFATLISANRQNFSGKLRLLEDNLPVGVTMQAMPMMENQNQIPVVFQATYDATIAGHLLDFKATSLDPVANGTPIVGGYRNLAQLVDGPPNRTLYYGCQVDRLPVAVVKPLPFRIEIVPPKAPLVQNGSLRVKVFVHRKKNFKGPVTLQFPYRPPGVGTRRTLQVPANKRHAFYPLNANSKAEINQWPMVVLANANINGNAWVSSQLETFQVAEPRVTMEIERVACRQGETAQVVCKLNQNHPYIGTGTARLLGTPPGVTVKELKFDKDTQELIFQVATSDMTPVGRHKGIFCQISIPYEQDSMIAKAGTTELRVDAPESIANAEKQDEQPIVGTTSSQEKP